MNVTSKKLDKQLNAKMIKAAEASVAGEKDGRISIKDAEKIIHILKKEDYQKGVKTLNYIIKNFNWTPKSLVFAKEFFKLPPPDLGPSFLPKTPPYLGNTLERMEVLMYKNDIYIFHKSSTDSIAYVTRWNPLKDPEGKSINSAKIQLTSSIMPIELPVVIDKGFSGTFIDNNTIMLAHKQEGGDEFWTFKINLDENFALPLDQVCITDLNGFFKTDLTPAITAYGSNVYFAFRAPENEDGNKYICVGLYNLNTEKYEKVVTFEHAAAENAPSIVPIAMNTNINETDDGLIEVEQEVYLMTVWTDAGKHLNFGEYSLVKGLEGEALAKSEKSVDIDTPLAIDVVDQNLVQFLYNLSTQKGYGVIDFNINVESTLGHFGEHINRTDNAIDSSVAPTVLQIGNQSYLFYTDSNDENKIKYHRIR